MKSSKYGSGNTDFSKLKCIRPIFYHWNKLDFQNKGCGQTALGFLTGVWPARKDNEPLNDKYIRNFLRQHKIRSFEINKANLSNKKDASLLITDQHVMLVSLIMKRAESSWIVLYNGKMIHNFDIIDLSYIHLLNYPWRSGYVLYRDDWR